MNHGETAGVNVAVWVGPDPDLALVAADLHAWAVAHPCECEALCECDRGGDAA
jgi:hypothetical protein